MSAFKHSGIRQSGLWLRIALVVTLGFLVVFAAFSLLGEYAMRFSAESIRNERLTLTKLAARQMEDLIAGAVVELEEITIFVDFSSADLAQELGSELAEGQVHELFAPGFVFLDADGRIVWSEAPEAYAPGSDMAGQPHVAQAMQSGTVAFSEPFAHPVDGQPVAAIVVPVYQDERLTGLVSGLFMLNGPRVRAILREAAEVGETGHASLIDRRGIVLGGTLDLPLLEGIEHPYFYPRVMAAGEPAIETTPFLLPGIVGETFGEKHVMAVAPLHSVPWGVAVGGDEDETFAGVWRLRQGLILLTSVTMAAVWVVTLVLTRRLLRPVTELTEAAQDVAQGNLQTNLSVSGPGEIGEMSRALEQMRQQLQANIEELGAWNEALAAQVAAQTKQLQTLLHQLYRAQEEERGRLSRELHDEIGQMLTALGISLEVATESLPEEDVATREQLEASRDLVEKTIGDLSRITAGLRPGVLDKLGLLPALDWVGDYVLRPSGITVTIETVGLPKRLPPATETVLFRIAQEAMNNTARHSQASRMDIRLTAAHDVVTMTLADDGQGAALPDDSSADNGGLGLRGMQERAAMLGGQVTVASAPGEGTVVTAVIPLSEIED